MSSTLYGIYEQSTLSLAGTLVVNHTMVGTTMNNNLINNGYPVDPNDKTSWRYYLNMAGEYTQADRDYCSTINPDGAPCVYVTVAGNLGPYQAVLDYDLINAPGADPAILGAYQYGTRAYENLLNQYPGVELLIRGILAPIPLAISTKAEDWAILYLGGYYRQFLDGNPRAPYFALSSSNIPPTVGLEDNEVNVIPMLETYIKSIMARWFNRDFAAFNNLSLPLNLGAVFGMAVSEILNIRIGNVHTAEVHSYFIQEAFASAGLPPSWALALAKPQAVYVYRNLDYFKSLCGQSQVFDDLVNNVLEPSNIPLVGVMTYQDTSLFTDNLRPTASLRKIPITTGILGAAITTDTVKDIIIRETDLAMYNPDDQEGQIDKINAGIAASGADDLMTQVVISDVIQLGDMAPITFPEFLMYAWMLYAYKGKYTGLIYTTDPVTGNSLPLTPLTALLLANYCYNVGFLNIVPEHTPDFKIRFSPMSPTTAPPGLPLMPSSGQLDTMFFNYFQPDELQDLIGSRFPVGVYGTVGAFFKDMVGLYSELARKYRVYSNTADAFKRAYGERLVSKLYYTNEVVSQNLTPQDYTTFITDIGINLTGLKPADYRALFSTLVSLATGNTTNSFLTLEGLQNAAIGVIKAFSSYSVQYITSITSQELTSGNSPQPRTWITGIRDKRPYYFPLPYTNSFIDFIDTTVYASTYCRAAAFSIFNDNNCGILQSGAERSGSLTRVAVNRIKVQSYLKGPSFTATFS